MAKLGHPKGRVKLPAPPAFRWAKGDGLWHLVNVSREPVPEEGLPVKVECGWLVKCEDVAFKVAMVEICPACRCRLQRMEEEILTVAELEAGPVWERRAKCS